MVALSFNAQGVAPNAALEAIPSGIYDAVMTNSTEKPTKADDGSTYIELEYTIRHPDPSLNGRKVFDRLNLNNKKSQQAVDIAYGTLSAICHVTGRLHIADTAQLHGIPLKLVVAKVERQDQKSTFSNDVKGYKDSHGNDPGQSQGGQPQGGAPAGTPSWANNGPQGGQPQGQYNAGQPQGGQPPQWANGAQQGYGGQPQGQYNAGQPQGGQPPQWANGAQQGYGGQPNGGQPGYDPAHQQGHGTPGHGGPGQPGMGEQHAYNPPAGGQPQPQPGQQVTGGQPPQWANNGQGGQPQGNGAMPPQGGQPNGGAPQMGAAPPWAQQPQG